MLFSDLDPAMRDRFNRLYDALAAIENTCELASEDAWGGVLSGIHETASVALEAERKALRDDHDAYMRDAVL